MKKIIGLVMMIVLVLSACSGGDEKAGKSRATTPGEIVINGDYVVPPTAHGNPFIGGYIGGGMEPYLQDTLFSFTPIGEDNYKSHLGESYEVVGNKVIVTLREGLKWSDGTDLTSADVLTSYQMWIGKKQVWDFLEDIVALDERTVEFDFKIESKLMMNLLSDVRISGSEKEYGERAKAYADVAATGREWHDETNSFWFSEEANEKLTQLNEELDSYKPNVIGTMNSGAFKLDRLTTGEAVLVRNEEFYNETGVDKLKIVRATTPEVAANLMIDGTLDIHSGGMTEDLSKQVRTRIDGYTEFYLPEYSQMSVVFNVNKPFADTKAFRVAMGYLMNAEEMLPLAEVGSMPAETSTSGLPLSLQEIHGVGDWAKENLSQREYDPAKAESILTEAGWTKGSDGIWLDETGQKVSFDFVCNNGWGSALLPGEAFVNELQSFGFDVTFKPMESAAYDAFLRNGEHTVAIEFAPPSNILYANSYGTYDQLYRGRAWLFGMAATQTGELFIENATGDQVDVIALTKKLFTATGDEQTELTKELMELTNENAFFIPFLEKGFPVRVLKTNIDLGIKEGALVQDARFSGVAETMFAAFISEGSLKNSVKEEAK